MPPIWTVLVQLVILALMLYCLGMAFARRRRHPRMFKWAATGFASWAASLGFASASAIVLWAANDVLAGVDIDIDVTRALPLLSALASVFALVGLVALARAVFIDR